MSGDECGLVTTEVRLFLESLIWSKMKMINGDWVRCFCSEKIYYTLSEFCTCDPTNVELELYQYASQPNKYTISACTLIYIIRLSSQIPYLIFHWGKPHILFIVQYIENTKKVPSTNTKYMTRKFNDFLVKSQVQTT